MEIKNKIIAAIKKAVESAVKDEVLKSSGEFPEIALEVPPKAVG